MAQTAAVTWLTYLALSTSFLLSQWGSGQIKIPPFLEKEKNNTFLFSFDQAKTFYSDFESQMVHLHIVLCASHCTFPYKGKRLERRKRCAYCYCDHLCHVYGDCCPDIVLLDRSLDMPDHFPATWEATKALTTTGKYTSTCEEADMKPPPDQRDAVYDTMVNYCPSSQYSNKLSTTKTKLDSSSSSDNNNNNNHDDDNINTNSIWQKPTSPLSQRINQSRDAEEEPMTQSAWEELEAKCQNRNKSVHWKFLRPVTSSSGVVFRNRYCAECHEQAAEELTKWFAHITCPGGRFGNPASDADAYRFATRQAKTGCMITFLKDADKTPVRKCRLARPPIIASCNQTGSWRQYDSRIERACASSFTNVVDSVYKNVFCFWCNTNLTQFTASQFLNTVRSPGYVNRVTFYALLALDTEDAGGEAEAEGVASPSVAASAGGNPSLPASPERLQCGGQTVLDPIHCQCRQVRCGASLQVRNNTCVSIFTSLNFHGLSVCSSYRLTPLLPATPLLPVTPAALFDDFVMFVQTSLQRLARRLLPLPAELAQSWTRSRPVETTTVTPVPHCVENHRWRQSLSPECQKKNDLNTEIVRVKVSDMLRFFPLLNTTFCPHVNLTEQEFRNYMHHLRAVGMSEHNITTDTVAGQNETYHLICLEDFRKATATTAAACGRDSNSTDRKAAARKGFQDSWTVLGLLSVLCTCVSLLSLLCVIVTYAVLKPLRANMGTSTLALSCLLFAAQALHEVGMEQYEVREVCAVLGVLIHFLWLWAVFMMTSCTLQLFYCLVYPLQARGVLASSRVLKASLALSSGLSLLVIGLVMTGNQLLHGDLGYPHPYLCFIRRPLSRQLGFGLPLGLAVLLNTVTFVVTIFHVRRLPDLSRALENRVSLIACFRLSIITGLTWLTLFMLTVPGTRPWLEYISVLLLGLQGLLLASTLLLNKRVFRLWREFFRQQPQGKGAQAMGSRGRQVSSSVPVSTIAQDLTSPQTSGCQLSAGLEQ